MGKISNTIIELDRVDSTNLYAERLLKQEIVEDGTVIIATAQTAGKGQGENTWETEPGKDLTFTVILHPTFLNAAGQFLLSKAISLGVCDFLANYIDDVLVKWPNDVFVYGKKIGGILIRHTVNNEMLQTTIVGIGININQTSFDPQLSTATSLSLILGREFILEETLSQLCEALDNRYAMLRNEEIAELENDYLKSLLGFGETRRFRVKDVTVEGVIRGVDDFGRLLVEHPGMPVRTYAHKEIEFVSRQ